MVLVMRKCWILCFLCTAYMQAFSANEIEETKEITLQLAGLEPRSVTPENLFKISTGKQLSIVKKIPHLGPWIKKKIKNSYKIYDTKLFKIAERSASLLRLCSLACDGFECKIDVVSLQSKYQDLLYAIERSSYQFSKDALMSLKEHRVGLLRLKKKQSWNMLKQMKRMLARHQGEKQNFRGKLEPILQKLTQLVQKIPAAINRSIEECNSELTSRTTETAKLRDEWKNLQDEIAKMTQEVKDHEQSIPKLKNDKESKEKARDVLSAEIQKRKTCVKKRQDGRSAGPFYWMTTHDKEGKYALRTARNGEEFYAANVENKQGIKDSNNEDYAQMNLEKQEDGNYKIFSKKHGGVLYCSESINGEALAYFSKDPEYEDDGREIWELNVYENPVFKMYNQKCRNNLCVKVDKHSGVGQVVVSECSGENDNEKWRILKKGVDEYEDDSNDDNITPSSTPSGAQVEKKISPKKLRKQELPKKAAVSCGEKIDDKRLDTLKRELREIDRKISSANYSIDSNRLEIQMKNLAIAPKKVSLKSSEVRMNEAREAKIRFASASKAFSTFAKAVCEMKEYLELWKESKPIQMASEDTTALIPAPSQRDAIIRSGYTWLAYGLAAYDSYRGLRPAKEAATTTYVDSASAAEKTAFLNKSEELLKEVKDLVTDYSSESGCT